MWYNYYSRVNNYLDTLIVAQTFRLRATPAQTKSLCYECSLIFRFYYNMNSASAA